MTQPPPPGDEAPTRAGAPRRSVLEALGHKAAARAQVSLTPDDGGGALIDPASTELGADRSIQQYQLLGEVARGGVGIILRGHDVDLGRDVAVKVLRPDHADRATMVQRFIEEAQIGGQLQHPGIVPVYELGVRDDGRPFFTMKFVKGRTLAQLLQELHGQPGARRRLLSIFHDVCQTVAYAHSKGVVHRDLKPSNVMVGAFGEVLVVDWGLAKVLDRGRAGGAPTVQTLQSQVSVIETIRSSDESHESDSMTGSVLGTPAYMAPEQARGEVEQVDQRTDVFALGCLLCQILTGSPPYTGSQQELLLKASTAALGDAHGWLEGCGADPELVELARRCMTPAMAGRPQHAGVIADALRDHLESVEERAQAAVVAAAEARQKRRLTVVAALAVLLLGTGAWWTSATRAAQRQRVDTAVERLLAEAAVLGEADELVPALDAIQRGSELWDTGPASPALRSQLDARRAELGAALDRQRFVDRLALLAEVAATAPDVERSADSESESEDALRRQALAERDAAFAELFAELDGDLLSLPLPEAVELVRETGLPVEVGQALDAWAATRRGLDGLGDPTARHLLQVALAADPDTARMPLRQALLSLDVDGLRRLARDDPARLSEVTAQVLASALIQLDALEDALGLLSEVLPHHRSSLPLNLLKASALQRLGRVEDAVGPLSVALGLAPDRLETLLTLGEAHLAGGHLDEAEAVLLDASRRHPEASEPWRELATVHWLGGDVAAVVSDLEQAAARKPTDRRLQFDLARARYELGGSPAAEESLREAAAASRDPGVLLALSWAHSPGIWGTQEQELDLAERAVELDPELTAGWSQVARVRQLMGDEEGALRAIDQALARAPDDAAYRTRRGRILWQLHDDPRAGLEDVRAAVDHPMPADAIQEHLVARLAALILRDGGEDLPDDAWTWMARCERAQRDRDLAAAEAAARRAVELAPDLWCARWNLAYVLGRRAGKRDETIAAYHALIRVRPDHLYARTNVGMRLLTAGDLDAAVAQFGRGVGYSRHPARLAHLGEAYWRQGRQAAARRLFDEAEARVHWLGIDSFAQRTIARCLAIDPESPSADLQRAERLATEYLGWMPQRDDAHEVMGLVYYRQGALDLARQALADAEARQLEGIQPMTAFLRALTEEALGERGSALGWLQRGAAAVQQRSVADPFVLTLVKEAAAAFGN